MFLEQLQIYNSIRFANLVLLLTLIDLVTPQTFIRNCNDAMIVRHTQDFQHSYCSHACRPGAEQDSVCSASGNCVCSPPCSNTATAPPVTPANDICPPSSGNPSDPDSNFSQANCLASCANECPGGTGLRCEEVSASMLPANTFANICTCSCPTTLCGAMSGNTTIIPIKFPLLLAVKKKKKKMWLILKKIWLCCLIFVKIFTFKSVLLSIYFHIFWELIDSDLRYFYWILRSTAKYL